MPILHRCGGSFVENYTYIVECRDGSWYTGWTKNLEKRIEAHNSGRGAKYTRSRRPVKLIYFECFETGSQARRREYAIKQLTRQQKERLIQAKEMTEKTDIAAKEKAARETIDTGLKKKAAPESGYLS